MTKLTKSNTKLTESDTELTEFDTESITEIDSVSDTELTEFDTESLTELTEPITETDSVINTELDRFVTESAATGDITVGGVKAAAEEKIEAITQEAAKAVVAGGANGLLMLASSLSKTELKISPIEIDSLADDIAPVVVKYGNDLSEAPPWLKAVLKYRVELIALKGLSLFGVTVYMQFKEQKRLQLIAETEAKKASMQGGDI